VVLVLLVGVFILVPLVELYLIVQVVGPSIGAPWTIALLALSSVLGSVLLRLQGRSVWRSFNAEMTAGRIPHRELLDGVLVIFGGAFLITPGFVTDAVGLALLLPPTRALVRRRLVRRLGRQVVAGVAGTRRRRRPVADYDVEGTATDADPHPSPTSRRAPSSPPRLER
jgi:UPF0716 protein FxsA